MFYIFIFESIGTSELMLIGLVALIVFGPRKLPELARTIGKTMAEFRRSTDDFKKTWEKEIAFEEEKNISAPLTDLKSENKIGDGNSISRSLPLENNESEEISLPQIKEMSKDEFDKISAKDEIEKPKITRSESGLGKQDWL